MTARFTLAALIVLAGCERDGVDPPSGNVHPVLALPVLDDGVAGARFDPATLRGTPAIVVLFQPSCRYCIDELPIVSRLAAAAGVRAIAIHVRGDLARSRRLLDQLAFDGIALVDDGSVLAAWKVRGVPYTLYLDRAGIARRAYAGSQTEATLRDALSTIR
jgi:hypothetical protein